MFVITCDVCKWRESNSGSPQDLAHLVEFKNPCKSCGRPRRFKCPKCGRLAKMKKA